MVEFPFFKPKESEQPEIKKRVNKKGSTKVEIFLLFRFISKKELNLLTRENFKKLLI